MRVPSGRVLDESDLNIIRRMGEVGLVEYRDTPFTMVSGNVSNIYVRCREDLTDHPDLVWKVGRKTAEVVYEHSVGMGQQCLIGIPSVGRTFAQAASMVGAVMRRVSDKELPLISFRVMREQKKKYGAHQKWIEGDYDSLRRYWLVDNVATDGGSKFKAADRVEEDGYPSRSMPVLIWIDRQQGAVSRLLKAGFKQVVVVYNLLDVTFVYSELGLWPKSAVDKVEAEIRAHQFVS